MDQSGDKLLIERINRGDEGAFRQLFDRYRSRLFVLVEQRTHSRADAEEIVQETTAFRR